MNFKVPNKNEEWGRSFPLTSQSIEFWQNPGVRIKVKITGYITSRKIRIVSVVIIYKENLNRRKNESGRFNLLEENIKLECCTSET